MAVPLIITEEVVAMLADLRKRANQAPIDMKGVVERLRRPRGRREHQDRMNGLTVVIPGPHRFFATFSVETGHPCGTARHLSVSIDKEGRVPSPEAVEIIASHLGFTGTFNQWAFWAEPLKDGGNAINVVQPIGAQAGETLH
jgi:hypothetical protein